MFLSISVRIDCQIGHDVLRSGVDSQELPASIRKPDQMIDLLFLCQRTFGIGQS